MVNISAFLGDVCMGANKMMSSLSGLCCRLLGNWLLFIVSWALLSEVRPGTPIALPYGWLDVARNALRSVSMGWVGAIGYST